MKGEMLGLGSLRCLVMRNDIVACMIGASVTWICMSQKHSESANCGLSILNMECIDSIGYAISS